VSITTISGVSNGSTLTYLFGADERTGLVKKASLTTLLLLAVEAYGYATGGVQDAIYNFDLNHWGFTRAAGETVGEYLVRVSRSRFLKGKDNACYSLTLQGAYADNAVWQTYPETYYLSYITEQTERSWLSGRYYPRPRMNPAMLPHSAYIGQKQFLVPPIPVAGFDPAQWWENDGAVPAYSQMYPHISGEHPVGGEFDSNTQVDRFEKGKWYFRWERDVDHLDVCVCPEIGQIGWQRRFYIGLFEMLSALPG